jgi:predicted MPP superfamily phosphohydrolase
MSLFTGLLVLFGISQLYWFWRGYRLLARKVQRRAVRLAIMAAVLALYAFLYSQNFGGGRLWGRSGSSVHLTLHDALVTAPFLWWAASSILGFLIVLIMAIPRGIVASIRRMKRPTSEGVASPSRRQFLERATTVAASAPFVAGAYGLFIGRVNLQTTEQTIKLERLPREFEGFRICQLSDIHIGPFMPSEEIRKYVAIANSLKADLMVLTGDFVTFDPTTQAAAVEALSGVRAPMGVYGCLGNHDSWTRVEDSITELFRQAGVCMLRGEAVPVTVGKEWFQLIGVDFQSHRKFGPSPAVPNLLGNIEHLIVRDRPNILLSHNPDTFDRAAELGIDLSLAGHTHGGQLALEFISPELAPSRLVTPYVSGWFRKPGGQLYVNRGIGTIGVPMRVGAPPEITVYKLTRA